MHSKIYCSVARINKEKKILQLILQGLRQEKNSNCTRVFHYKAFFAFSE
jgi:hypothetical protein